MIWEVALVERLSISMQLPCRRQCATPHNPYVSTCQNIMNVYQHQIQQQVDYLTILADCYLAQFRANLLVIKQLLLVQLNYLKSPGFLLNHFSALKSFSLAVPHKFSSFSKKGDIYAAAPIYKTHTLLTDAQPSSESNNVLVNVPFTTTVLIQATTTRLLLERLLLGGPDLLLPGTWLIRSPSSQILTAKSGNQDANLLGSIRTAFLITKTIFIQIQVQIPKL